MEQTTFRSPLESRAILYLAKNKNGVRNEPDIGEGRGF